MKGRSLPIRLGSLFLALIMLVTVMPLNVFAEVEPANWTDDEKTARYWPIPSYGRLVKVSSAEPIKNPSLRFIGGYTRPDGREVVRLAFGGYSGAVSGVWERLLLKPDANFNDMIDWTESGMGEKRPEQFTNNHDGYNFNGNFIKFKPLSALQAGSGNVHMMDLGDKGTMTVKSGLLGVHYETPIDLVLNEGQSIKSLKTNPLVQMRLMDSKFERIYSTTIAENEEVPYSSYTMSTFIPVRENLSTGLIRTDVVRNYENIFQSASSYIKYNEEKGYIDVYTRRTHGSVESRADNGGSFNSTDNQNKGDYGFRQSFDKSLIKILKPQDESGTVARIFIANDDDTLKHKSADPNVPLPGNRIDYSLNQIKQEGNVGIIEVSNNTPGKTFMPTGTDLTGYGDSTVVRYFIDKDKLKEAFGTSDIVAYEFFSTVFAKNKTGVEEFKSPTREEDIDLKRGDKIHLRFDGRRDLITLGTMDYRGSVIQIGDDQFAIGIRSSADKASYTGGGITWSDNYMRSMEISVPFDIKIKKDTPVTIFSRKTKLQKVSPGMTVRFEYTDQDDSGNPIKKNKTYRFERPLIDGYTRNEKGEIFNDGVKINDPQDSLFVDNKSSLVTSRQANYAGGILTRTADAPDIDEIFTDSAALTGRSKYDRVNVYLYDADKSTVDTAKRIGAIKASDKKIEMNVNGADVQGYEWTSDSNAPADRIKTDTWAVKDTPLYFTNQDVLQNALENEKPVVEQVQAKVNFDLNGGTMPLEVKSYQGVDEKQKPGTEHAYVTSRSQETESVTRIAPMNTKFANQEGYKANGFTGENVSLKDHNGKDLADDALKLREFPTDENTSPKKEGFVFLGWTTKKLEGTAKQVTEAYSKLEEAKTANDVNNQNKNYIFTNTSPITKTMTVYAAFGAPTIRLHTNPIIEGKEDYVETQTLSDEVIKAIGKKNADLTKVKAKLEEVYSKPEFTMEGYSLVGFSRNKDAQEPDVNITGEGLTKDLYLRDGDEFVLEDTENNYTFNPEKGLDLYAVWKPDFTVKADKKWFDKENTEKTVDSSKTNGLKFALIGRPAVGTAGQEVVVKNATYYPIQGTVKDYEPNGMTWTGIKGYDKKGRRMSYLVIELNAKNEALFNQGSTNWEDYGIKIEEKEENPDGTVAHYGRKSQVIELGSGDKVDAFSSATVRKHTTASNQEGIDPHGKDVKLGYFDTTGYVTTVNNTEFDLAPPTIDQAYTDETKVTVHPPKRVLDKLTLTMPDGSVAVYYKNLAGDGYVKNDQESTTTYKVDQDQDGNFVITTPNEQPLEKDQVFTAKGEITAGGQTKDATATMTVQEKPESNKVTNISQGKITDPKDKAEIEKGNVPIKFVVPEPAVTDKVAPGTKYTVVLVDDDGNETVTDYTYEVPTEGAAAIPGTTQTIPVPKDKLQGKKVVIRAQEPNKKPVDSDQFTPDLVGPNVTKSQLRDERWRRWANLDLDLSEIEEGPIRIAYTENGKETVTDVNSKQEAKQLVESLPKSITDVKISALDIYGNEGTKGDVTYKKIDQTVIHVTPLRINRSFALISATEPNTKITVRVYDGSVNIDELPRNEYFLITGGTEPKVKVTKTLDNTKRVKFDLVDSSGAKYKLKKGDKVDIIGTVGEPGQPGYKVSNPYTWVVE